MNENHKAVAREVKRIYFDTDVRMKSIPKACSKGCSHCCYQIIRVHYGEGSAIEKFINEEMPLAARRQAKENMISWFKYFNKNTPSRTLAENDLFQFEQKLAADHIPCPFLIENECSIYRARPLVCRTHSVTEAPELCEQNPLRNGDLRGVEVQTQKFKEVSRVADMAAIRLLPYAVQEALGLNQSCKPIMFNAVPTLRVTR